MSPEIGPMVKFLEYGDLVKICLSAIQWWRNFFNWMYRSRDTEVSIVDPGRIHKRPNDLGYIYVHTSYIGFGS